MGRIVIAGLNIQYDCPILNFTCSHSLMARRDPIYDQPRLLAVRPGSSVPIHVRIQLVVVRAIREVALPPCNHPPVINAGTQFLDDYRRKDGAGGGLCEERSTWSRGCRGRGRDRGKEERGERERERGRDEGRKEGRRKPTTGSESVKEGDPR